jgi:hypothetical protein
MKLQQSTSLGSRHASTSRAPACNTGLRAGVRAAPIVPSTPFAPLSDRSVVAPIRNGVVCAAAPSSIVKADSLPWQAAMSDIKKRKDIKTIMSESPGIT